MHSLKNYYIRPHNLKPVERRVTGTSLAMTIWGITGLPYYQYHEERVYSVYIMASKRLAPGLAVEVTATGGVIEAVSVRDAKTFAFGTQWHPEFKAMNNPDSVKLFAVFGDAVRAHAAKRGMGLKQSA